jgi:uncharacterized lipoprotein NlpE involved in copper resistance
MKKIITAFAIVGFIATLQSCNNQTAVDPTLVTAQVDSLASSKIETASAYATTECETRMATELKTMTDSIVNAKQMEVAAQ